MIYGSVCSGIEAATVAWHSLGWRAAFFSEIEKFPRDVLSHHYPDIPLHGDFTTIKKGDYADIDVLVGGTPCQSFSIAGLREGLTDPRGNLMLEFGALANRLRPTWLVWENVPGVLSSNGGRDFGTFLGMLGELGYGFAYRVLDAQYFGVAQRRRRVFVVGYLGDWRPAAAVLFEQHSLSGNPAPRRETRQDITQVAGTLTSNGGDLNRPAGNANELDFCVATAAAHAFKVRGGCEGGGKGYLGQDECAFTISTNQDQHIAISTNALTKTDQHAVAFGVGESPDIAHCLRSGASKADKHESTTYVQQSMAIRRLTPRECERLQGFTDDYTLINDKTPDGPRYKALGNSMAVPVMRWIGSRIADVDAIISPSSEAAA